MSAQHQGKRSSTGSKCDRTGTEYKLKEKSFFSQGICDLDIFDFFHIKSTDRDLPKLMCIFSYKRFFLIQNQAKIVQIGSNIILLIALNQGIICKRYENVTRCCFSRNFFSGFF